MTKPSYPPPPYYPPPIGIPFPPPTELPGDTGDILPVRCAVYGVRPLPEREPQVRVHQPRQPVRNGLPGNTSTIVVVVIVVVNTEFRVGGRLCVA